MKNAEKNIGRKSFMKIDIWFAIISFAVPLIFYFLLKKNIKNRKISKKNLASKIKGLYLHRF